MKALVRAAACLVLSAAAGLASAAPAPQCASEAVSRAKKLLTFHFGEDDRIQIDPDVKEMAPIRNPANKNQQFYKGNYRMRLIYYVSGKDCTLMGQEILEFASL